MKSDTTSTSRVEEDRPSQCYGTLLHLGIRGQLLTNEVATMPPKHNIENGPEIWRIAYSINVPVDSWSWQSDIEWLAFEFACIHHFSQSLGHRYGTT
jgi:hypothetical protein